MYLFGKKVNFIFHKILVENNVNYCVQLQLQNPDFLAAAKHSNSHCSQPISHTADHGEYKIATYVLAMHQNILNT
jgi:hypothetical protein